MIGLGSGYGRLARTIGWRSTAKPSHPWKPNYLVISSETISGEPSLSHGVTELGHNITGVSTMLGETPCKDMSNTCRNDQSTNRQLKAKNFIKHFEMAKEKHIFA